MSGTVSFFAKLPLHLRHQRAELPAALQPLQNIRALVGGGSPPPERGAALPGRSIPSAEAPPLRPRSGAVPSAAPRQGPGLYGSVVAQKGQI